MRAHRGEWYGSIGWLAQFIPNINFIWKLQVWTRRFTCCSTLYDLRMSKLSHTHEQLLKNGLVEDLTKIRREYLKYPRLPDEEHRICSDILVAFHDALGAGHSTLHISEPAVEKNSKFIALRSR